MSDGDVSSELNEQEGAQSEQASKVNKDRRYFLIGATSAVAGVGAVGAAVPFVQFWNPSARARAAGAPVKIDFSKLQPGEMLSPIPAWRGKPIFLLFRDEAAVDALNAGAVPLQDPDSDNLEQQPDWARNPTRSSRPEIGVYVGICTHLGCSPKLVEVDNFGDQSQGGFFCPCHGSTFDLAGRVSANMPAPFNLEVPPYRFESDTVIVVGEEEGAA